MSIRSGVPESEYFHGLEGQIFINGTLYNVRSSTFREEVTTTSLVDTRDFNTDTNTINRRTVVTDSVITGTMEIYVDGLRDFRRDFYPGARAPAILGVSRSANGIAPPDRYFDVPEVMFGAFDHGGRDAQGFAFRTINFESQGPYNYVAPANASAA